MVEKHATSAFLSIITRARLVWGESFPAHHCPICPTWRGPDVCESPRPENLQPDQHQLINFQFSLSELGSMGSFSQLHDASSQQNLQLIRWITHTPLANFPMTSVMNYAFRMVISPLGLSKFSYWSLKQPPCHAQLEARFHIRNRTPSQRSGEGPNLHPL
jgi:hypothetical protein